MKKCVVSNKDNFGYIIVLLNNFIERNYYADLSDSVNYKYYKTKHGAIRSAKSMGFQVVNE